MTENSDSAILTCKFCQDSNFDSSHKLFEHLLSCHENNRKLCALCHRCFYSDVELEKHIFLHKSNRKGYIQCPHCSYNCLSKVTSIEHAAKHCSKNYIDYGGKDRLRSKSMKDAQYELVEDDFENGFSLHSIFCQFKSKKDGSGEFKCKKCRNQYDSSTEFVSHFKECDTIHGSPSVIEHLSHNENIQVVENTEDISYSFSLSEEDNCARVDDSSTVDNIRQLIRQYENNDSDGVLVEYEVSQDEIDSSDQPQPIEIGYVIVNNEENDYVEGSDTSKTYTPVEDDPISEFLKLPAKKSPTKTQHNDRSFNLRARPPKRPYLQMLQDDADTDEDDAEEVAVTKRRPEIGINKLLKIAKDVDSSKEDFEKTQIYLKEVNTLEMLTCDICNQMFSNQHFLDQHKDVHKKYIMQNKYFCRFCDLKRFSKVTALLEHVGRIHKTAKLYLCGICNQEFNKQAVFSNHIKETHSDVSGKFRYDDNNGLVVFRIKEINEKNPKTGSKAENEKSEKSDDVATTEGTDSISNKSIDCEMNLNPEGKNQEETIEILDESAMVLHDTQSGLEESLEVEDIIHIPNDADEINNVEKTLQGPSNTYGVVLKEAIVVLEDVMKNARIDLLTINRSVVKRSNRLHLKRVKSNKKYSIKSKKPSKNQDISSKNEKFNDAVKKTNSNVVIKVKSSNELVRTPVKRLQNSLKLKYHCHFCSKRFKDDVAFHLHIKSHFQEDSFLCICGVRMPTEELYLEHKNKYHSKDNNADIVLIKLNDESYMFVQQNNSITLQGSLKKVNEPSVNPLKFTKIAENTEYMGTATLTQINPRDIDRMKGKKMLKRNGIIVKKLGPEDIPVQQDIIKMTKAGEGIQPRQRPFELVSTYVYPDVSNDSMYNGVTHVTKLTTKSRNIPDFILKACEMPKDSFDIEPLMRKTYSKRVKPVTINAEDDSKQVTLVVANPLEHLLATQAVYPPVIKQPKKKMKEVDYEAIIRQNLSKLLTIKAPKKSTISNSLEI